MKTKRTLFLTALLLFVSHAFMAQTYYYNETKTFYENGYTYQCDTDMRTARVTLYNKESKYTYERLVFKDGSDANGAMVFHGMRPLENDDWTYQTGVSIVDKAFSAEERKRVAGKELVVTQLIDSSTGKVIEVYFNFIYTAPFATIPVSTYRKIELELKEKVWFTPTADGKRMKFIMNSWRQEISRLPADK
jgi:hypothetical protein